MAVVDNLCFGAPASSSTYAHIACPAHHYKLMATLFYKDHPAFKLLQTCSSALHMLANSIVHRSLTCVFHRSATHRLQCTHVHTSCPGHHFKLATTFHVRSPFFAVQTCTTSMHVTEAIHKTLYLQLFQAEPLQRGLLMHTQHVFFTLLQALSSAVTVSQG